MGRAQQRIKFSLNEAIKADSENAASRSDILT